MPTMVCISNTLELGIGGGTQTQILLCVLWVSQGAFLTTEPTACPYIFVYVMLLLNEAGATELEWLR